MQIEFSKEELNSFNQLYKNYHNRFVRFANAYVRDLPVAEDVAVEALMQYWENRHSLSEESNVPGYVLTIIKNKCLNWLRHQQIREEYSDKIRDYHQWELQTRIGSLQACEPSDLFTTEIEEIVRKTLEALPEKTRKIFLLNRYENKSYKEVAEVLGISPRGLEFHISKTLKLLQENLKDYIPLFFFYFINHY